MSVSFACRRCRIICFLFGSHLPTMKGASQQSGTKLEGAIKNKEELWRSWREHKRQEEPEFLRSVQNSRLGELIEFTFRWNITIDIQMKHWDHNQANPGNSQFGCTIRIPSWWNASVHIQAHMHVNHGNSHQSVPLIFTRNALNLVQLNCLNSHLGETLNSHTGEPLEFTSWWTAVRINIQVNQRNSHWSST